MSWRRQSMARSTSRTKAIPAQFNNNKTKSDVDSHATTIQRKREDQGNNHEKRQNLQWLGDILESFTTLPFTQFDEGFEQHRYEYRYLGEGKSDPNDGCAMLGESVPASQTPSCGVRTPPAAAARNWQRATTQRRDIRRWTRAPDKLKPAYVTRVREYELKTGCCARETLVNGDRVSPELTSTTPTGRTQQLHLYRGEQ